MSLIVQSNSPADLKLEHQTAVPGMGLAKAAQILSAFELARRHLLKETVRIVIAQDVLPLVPTAPTFRPFSGRSYVSTIQSYSLIIPCFQDILR
ncbi:MAG: hypothetical protein HYX94_13300 [Chloroflexi bacterium]|nr:hypothetical protein [Chloroflexota bacterium]